MDASVDYLASWKFVQSELYSVPSESTADHVVLCNETKTSESLVGMTTRVEHVNLPIDTPPLWEKIVKCLRSAKTKIASCEDFVAVIKQYTNFSQNYETLSLYVEKLSDSERNKMFKEVIPKMIELALSLPTLFEKPLPRLVAQRQMSVTMSQHQAACLLACAFFCMYTSHDGATSEKQSKRRSINFYEVFQSAKKPKRKAAKIQKLKCFMRYFERVTDSMPTGIITYHRRVLTNFPDWSTCKVGLTRIHVRDGLIEDVGIGMSQVDFANKCVGGGVMMDGCVQEEIRFTISPELIVARLLADKMEDNECVVVVGFERFCDYTGYGDTFQFKSDCEDCTPCDRYGRRITELIAIDATPFRGNLQQSNQFLDVDFRRELNKAHCGFFIRNVGNRHLHPVPVATGNWGCGAYHGDHRLKALIQIMACAFNRRDIHYFTFGDEKLKEDIVEFHRHAVEKNLTIQQLYHHEASYAKMLSQQKKKSKQVDDVFKYIISQTQQVV